MLLQLLQNGQRSSLKSTLTAKNRDVIMLNRIKHALDAAKAAAAENEGPGAPKAPDSLPQTSKGEDDHPPPLYALIALDEIGAGGDEIARQHIADARSRNLRAIFVLSTDSDFDIPHDPDHVREYIPAHEDIYRATMERPDVIELYRQYRFRLVLDKWRVREGRWIGESAGDLIARYRAESDPSKRPIQFRQI